MEDRSFVRPRPVSTEHKRERGQNSCLCRISRQHFHVPAVQTLHIRAGIAQLQDDGLLYGSLGLFLTSDKRLFCFWQWPNRFWSPPSLLCNGYRRVFSRWQGGWDVKLTLQCGTDVNNDGNTSRLSTSLHG
jgi:hypothetical protein